MTNKTLMLRGRKIRDRRNGWTRGLLVDQGGLGGLDSINGVMSKVGENL